MVKQVADVTKPTATKAIITVAQTADACVAFDVATCVEDASQLTPSDAALVKDKVSLLPDANGTLSSVLRIDVPKYDLLGVLKDYSGGIHRDVPLVIASLSKRQKLASHLADMFDDAHVKGADLRLKMVVAQGNFNLDMEKFRYAQLKGASAARLNVALIPIEKDRDTFERLLKKDKAVQESIIHVVKTVDAAFPEYAPRITVNDSSSADSNN